MSAESAPPGEPMLERDPAGAADGSAGQLVCYAHATARALARGDGRGLVPSPRRLNGPDHDGPRRRTLEGRSPRFGPVAEESDHRTMVSLDRESSIRRLVRRLVASEAELDAEELQRDVVASGCCPVDAAGRGDLVSISGRLRTVVYTPRTTLPTLEAELYDGSDVVTLVWLGRRHIAGIEPGRQLTIRGRVATRDDRKVVYNPYYELEPPR
jgi:hypothetical protein